MYPNVESALFYQMVLKLGLGDVWYKLFVVSLGVGVYLNRVGIM